VGGISRFPLALVVHPSFEAKTMKEFLAYVRANPGKVNYASPGNGSPHHLAMEMFKNRTKTFLTHIPYRGAAPAMADVMGGQVPCMFLDLASGLSVIQSGKVRALAIGSAKRIATLPDVPTLGEVGVADTEVFAFQGILGPKGLPANVTQRLNADLNKALASPAVVKRMQDFGMEALPGTPEQFRALARAEAKRWGEVIKAAGVKLD
jgi:tripartite-type tricarboxylate transporter receptor subunit TctC